MSSYSKTWNESSPAGSDLASTADDQLRDLKVAQRERHATEHFPESQTVTIQDKLAAGRHRPGIAGIMFKGTTAEIEAIRATRAVPAAINGITAYGPGEGALVHNTTTGFVQRYNATTDTFENVASFGAAASASTNTNAHTSALNFSSYFHTNVQNTTGRTIQMRLTVLAGNGIISSATVDRAWGFLFYVGASVPLTLVADAFLVRKLDSSNPDVFFGSGDVIVPPSSYYYIRTYNYFKVSGSWYYSIDNGATGGTVADFYTTSITSGALPLFTLLQTSL